MLKPVTIGSAVAALACLGLSQMSNPEMFGITSEPSRILFYGGSGLLAGALGLVALAGAAVWAVRCAADRRRGADHTRRG
ncbi:MAG: hypothetical protein A3G76_09735 [Acidobacteria bacterium RIFCSPLOWO2_12_FULL_65_11]|nr:MAG: hypothetical protein A3H95_08190 [Acidobacteria bacterium RIFCSPLOWO2_02_FULL_64_15]OFW34452.1 MAG: hypothetical protein A3G76_09735 [Acidobacteria bacterium RIFCSPLOWO2_12_FULL_65_11]